MEASIIPLESHLGPYRVLRQIGEGGMGVVYLGEDPGTGQQVALKVLSSQDREEKSKALIEEAVLARRIDHPHCVAVYGMIDGPEESPVIVSEFVDGLDARRFLDLPVFSTPGSPGPRFSPLAALLILEQMFRGLRFAHQIGITHQDIKPQNYLVARWMIDEIETLARSEGKLSGPKLEELFETHRDKAWIKLCDWGLALFQKKKVVGQGSVSMNYSQVAGEKRGGTLIYMSLEQLEGVGVSRRADIFPLGLILYELLSGHSALNARQHSEGLTADAVNDYVQFVMKVASSRRKSAVLRSDPGLSELRKQRRLMSLLTRMTARDKQRRLSSRDLEATLTDFIERLQRSPRALAGVSPAWSVIPGILSVAALSLLIYSYVPSDPNKQVNDPSPVVSVPKNERIPSLQSIDKDAARAFVKSGLPALNFRALESLDQESARVLSGFTGKKMVFGTLKRLPPDAAEALASSKVDELSFDSLEVLELPVASSLAQYKGCLSLGGLKTMTYNASLAMSAFSCRELRLDGYQSLHPNYLADFLAYEGQALSFNGVKQLDSQSAKHLAGFKGERLILRGLTHLSLADAQSLAQFRGVIDLAGLEYVDNKTLRYLQQRLETFKVSDAIRKRFRRVSKTQRFLYKTSITPQIAKTLVSEQYPQLILENLLSLDRATGEALSHYEGSGLHFHRLRSLEPGPAAEIAKCNAGTLCLNSLKSISAETASHLVTFKGEELRLGVQELDVASARMLASFGGSVLRLSKLAWVSPEVLKALVSFQGTKLYLGLRELSPEHARVAAEAKALDTLSLNAVTYLQRGAAQELLRYRGARLEFLQLRTLSPEVREVLQEFPGDVVLFGPRKLR